MQNITVQNQLENLENQLENKLRKPKAVPSRILIVEDDLTYQPFWEKVLRPIYPISAMDWVASTELAEELLLEEHRGGHPYLLVILNIYLSGRETGIDLWHRFKEGARNFIFIGDFNKADDQPICLTKPLEIEKCREVVSTLINLKNTQPLGGLYA